MLTAAKPIKLEGKNENTDTVERGFEMGYRFAHDEDRMVVISKILSGLSKEEGGKELLAEFEKKIAGEKNETNKTSN